MERGKLLKDASLLILEELQFRHSDRINFGKVVGEHDGVEYSTAGIDKDGSVYLADENGDFETPIADVPDSLLKDIIWLLEG